MWGHVLSSADARLAELYQRLQRIYVLLDDGDRRALATVGLTPTHYNLLRLLEDDAPDAAPHGTAGAVPGVPTGGGRSVSQLADLLLCTRGNITRLVRRLVEAGLVRTGSDPADQRLVAVSLTALGRERLTAAHAVFATTNRQRFSHLSDDDTHRLYELAGDLADQLIKQCDSER
ncbi:MarR family transcriptional regulator [Polymorphospora rubra]|uniref:MarR family transcriptional regulator n=1 Tax=Polymorphospora rubra TaxID=338584 RepID=A0A810MYU3_9ACTN|nr:MarR family transcriptional regulator [Polymorphospora rubra]